MNFSELPFEQLEADGAERFDSQSSAEVTALLMQYKYERQKGIVAPDTIGADKFFIEGFLNERISHDFWAIARDFLGRHYLRLLEFDTLAKYDSDRLDLTSPTSALQYKILNIIYNAAKSSDPYSVELLKNLYKTYHKREYMQLKRFRKISVPEILSLSETEDHGCNYYDMSRILGMCTFFGIELEEDCSFLYLLLKRVHEEIEREEEQTFYHFKKGLFPECMERVQIWMQRLEEINKDQPLLAAEQYGKVERFVAFCLKHHGYPDDYVHRCNLEADSLEMEFAKTFALLRSAFPEEEISFEEVQLYSHLWNAVSALVCVCEQNNDNVSQLLGISSMGNEREDECLFKPEKITVTDRKNAQSKPVNVAPIPNETAAVEDYLAEINELRRRLREKEQDCKHFKSQYDQTKMALEEAQELVTRSEADRKELYALRNYVYNLSEEMPEIQWDRLEEMKKMIGGRRFAIVGGHINWINKLRKEFPNWKYLDANISRFNDAQLLSGIEKVYFYTDHLSHGTYGKYIALVRENNIPFGYLHAINMERVIWQIYDEINSRV